jgi:hypothetical protein
MPKISPTPSTLIAALPNGPTAGRVSTFNAGMTTASKLGSATRAMFQLMIGMIVLVKILIMTGHGFSKSSRHPLGSPFCWRARRLEPRMDFSAFSRVGKSNCATLVAHGDLSLDQKHTILVVNRSAPEFSTAYSDLGHRRGHCNRLIAHV